MNRDETRGQGSNHGSVRGLGLCTSSECASLDVKLLRKSIISNVGSRNLVPVVNYSKLKGKGLPYHLLLR